MIATIVVSCIIGACAVCALVYLIRRRVQNKHTCTDCSQCSRRCAHREDRAPDDKETDGK